ALSADEVLDRIRKLADTEGTALRAGEHPIVAAGARRHFGGWKAAFEAAGCAAPQHLTWTREAVIAAIRDDAATGLPVNSARIMPSNANLYVAGRRRFGTWAAALSAAKYRSPQVGDQWGASAFLIDFDRLAPWPVSSSEGRDPTGV